MMIVQIAIPLREIDDKIIALMFLVVLFFCDCKFHLGSVFRIRNLE